MNDPLPNTDETGTHITGIHNAALTLITVAGIIVIAESLTKGWEFWVPPLMICALAACWFLHVTQYRQPVFRENFFLIFAMLVVFYHGVHRTDLVDMFVLFCLLMATAALLARSVFLRLILFEFFLIAVLQFVFLYRDMGFDPNPQNILQILLRLTAVFCIYRALYAAIRNNLRDRDRIAQRDREKESFKLEMEDFLVNISHELRTPVNVISGLSSIILKNEKRDDVASIQDAGFRLSRQIEDIQDFSEIQRGDVCLEDEKYRITSVLYDIIDYYNYRAADTGLELVIDLDPAVPAALKGDVRKLVKIIRHLLSNAVKFTKKGGIYLRIRSIRREYGVNLLIEVTDTGIGMTEEDIEKVSEGLYQANSGRNRSTGGVGLGLPIVYGFVRKMNGFVSIESERRKGTCFRISIAQEIVDPAPCLQLSTSRFINIAYHVLPDKYESAELREFYRVMASHLAAGLRLNLYSAPSLRELEKLLARGNITHVFMSDDEYRIAPDYFDRLAEGDVSVTVSAPAGFTASPGSRVTVLQKPLFAAPLIHILNGDYEAARQTSESGVTKPALDGLRALVVDDEPMNLVVATGLLSEYNMLIDTAASGPEAINKFSDKDYDIVFMDHMMPGMDGIEAMKELREIAARRSLATRMIALTANAVSGAREMFLKEGFDGFISKPIHIDDFERTMRRVLPSRQEGDPE